MMEHELKLHVPVLSCASLEKKFQSGHATQVKLRALYFDTPSRQLAQQNISLRLRRAGRRWEQTLKLPSEFMLARQELTHERDCPELDLSLYRGTPVQALMDKLQEPLALRYEAHITRRMRVERFGDGLVEIVLDQGYLLAGGLQLPVSELEIELKQGHPNLLVACASAWQRHHGLILDLRSKAERGDRLAQLATTLAQIPPNKDTLALAQQAVADFWSVRSSRAVTLQTDRSPEQALAVVMSECLTQICRNSALLAGVDHAHGADLHADELVHQLRVGIRRLRSAWALFKDGCELPSPEQRQIIKQFFSQLGTAREDHVLWQKLWSVLEAAGLPRLALTPAPETLEVQTMVRSAAFQSWQLEMLSFIHRLESFETGQSLAVPQPSTPLKKRLRAKLRRWHHQVLRDGFRFEALHEEKQHALRKKLKRLRYSLQFAEALFPPARIKVYRQRLTNLQDQLGDMNDWVELKNRLQDISPSQPEASMAIDWISSRLKQSQVQVSQGFKQLAQSDGYWR